MEFLIQEKLDSSVLIPLVSSMLEKLRLEPTEIFLAQQHRLQEAAKQLQKDREESQKKEEIKNFIKSATIYFDHLSADITWAYTDAHHGSALN